MAKILVIDDEEGICQSMSLVGKRGGHDTSCARTLALGVEMASLERFDVVFLDVRLPDGKRSGDDPSPVAGTLPARDHHHDRVRGSSGRRTGHKQRGLGLHREGVLG